MNNPAENKDSKYTQLQFTRDDVSAALNRAADYLRDSFPYETSETIEKQSYGDLVVNLGLGWLDNPNATAEQLIEGNWSEPAATVLGWAGIGSEDEDEDDDEDEDTYDRYWDEIKQEYVYVKEENESND